MIKSHIARTTTVVLDAVRVFVRIPSTFGTIMFLLHFSSPSTDAHNPYKPTSEPGFKSKTRRAIVLFSLHSSA